MTSMKRHKMKFHHTLIKPCIFAALPLLLLASAGCSLLPPTYQARKEQEENQRREEYLAKERVQEQEENQRREEYRAKERVRNQEEMEAKAKELKELKESFDEADYVPFAKPGTGSISGQAFAKTKGGKVRYAAGDKITLIPTTVYGVTWMGMMRRDISSVLSYGNNPDYIKHLPMDPRAATFTRTTFADAEGRFRFDELAPGDYLVFTTISWITSSTGFSDTFSGGFFYGRVTAENGKKTTVNLK